MIINAMQSAQTGMRRQADAFDSAVAKITSATLAGELSMEPPVGVANPVPADPSDQLLTGFTDMLIAQRLFMANLRAAQAADEMLEAATRIGE